MTRVRHPEPRGGFGPDCRRRGRNHGRSSQGFVEYKVIPASTFNNLQLLKGSRCCWWKQVFHDKMLFFFYIITNNNLEKNTAQTLFFFFYRDNNYAQPRARVMTPNNVSKRTGTLAQCLLMNERALIEKLPPERVLATADTTCAPRPRFSAVRLGRSDRRVCACNDAAAAAPDQTDASLLCDLRPDSSALLYRKTRIAKLCLSRVFAQQQVSREQTMLSSAPPASTDKEM